MTEETCGGIRPTAFLLKRNGFETYSKKTNSSLPLASWKYHFFTDTGDINDPHAFKSTLPPTSQTQHELPDKDKAISSKESDANEKSETSKSPVCENDAESGKKSESGKNLNSSSDSSSSDLNKSTSGSSESSVEVQKEDQNTRDSDSREAAEQLAKIPEEEVDDDKDVYLVR